VSQLRLDFSKEITEGVEQIRLLQLDIGKYEEENSTNLDVSP